MDYNYLFKNGRRLCLSMLLLLSFFISSFCSHAQTPLKKWDKAFGGTDEDLLALTVPTLDGGFLLGGTSSSPASGDKISAGKGNQDFWIVKIDSNGTKVFDKSFGGSLFDKLSSIISLPDGGFLLGGMTSSPADGDVSQAGMGRSDFWVIKVNSTGIKQWDKRFGGAKDDELSKIIQTSDGGYLLAGSSSSSVGGDKSEFNRGGYDYWVLKTDAFLNKQWDKTFGGEDHDFLKDVIPVGGGYLLGGDSFSPVSGDKSSSLMSWTRPGSDLWIIKMNNDKSKVWDKVYGGDKQTTLTALLPISKGYLIAGTDFALDFSERDLFNYYLTEIKSDGTLIARKSFGGNSDESLSSIIATPDGGYLLGGFSNSNEVGDKSEDRIGPENTYERDFWLLKLDQALNKKWDKTYGGDKNDIVASTLITKDGGLLVSGYSQSGLSGNKTQPSRGKNDFWIVRLGNESEPRLTDFTFTQAEKNAVIVPVIMNSDQVSKVEFWANGIKIGEDVTTPFQFVWKEPAPKTHFISAKLYFRSGQVHTSFTMPYTHHLYNVEFYRAINISGPAVQLGGVLFESELEALNFGYQAARFADNSIALKPATNPDLEKVIRSSGYSTANKPAIFNLFNVPKGPYEVYLYVWEDNYPQSFSIHLNGVLAEKYKGGGKGSWAKLGPYKINLEGKLEVKASEGDANISAIELYKIKDFERFYRAINLNGPELKIQNLKFENGNTAPNFEYEGRIYANQAIPLVPKTDSVNSLMIRSSVYSTKSDPARFVFSNVPKDYIDYAGQPILFGVYSAYIYIWEDNYPSTFNIKSSYTYDTLSVTSGKKGEWKVIGPVLLEAARDIPLSLEVFGGDGNISGIELWKHPAQESNVYNASYAHPASISATTSETVVYPNSIQEELKIKLADEHKGRFSARITDLSGRVYFAEERKLEGQRELSLKMPSGLTPGIYFLKLSSGKKQEVIRLNKE